MKLTPTQKASYHRYTYQLSISGEKTSLCAIYLKYNNTKTKFIRKKTGKNRCRNTKTTTDALAKEKSYRNENHVSS